MILLVEKVVENSEVLDKTLQPIAPEWPIASIAAIDRNVLRMGLYELSECRDTVPPKVAINEAVELAKAFGSDSSSRFVNGVLGTAYKKLGIVADENDESKRTNKKDDSKANKAVEADKADDGGDAKDGKDAGKAKK